MKKPTTEAEFDLAAVRDIKRLLNRATKKLILYERAMKKRQQAQLQSRLADGEGEP